MLHSTRSGVAALVLSLTPPATVRAQELARSLEQLQVLVRVGDTITVSEAAGTEITGSIAGLSSSELVLEIAGNLRRLNQDQIAVIRQRRPDPLTNGALWGFGVGAVLGLYVAAIGAGADGGYADTSFALVPVLISGGLGSGVGVGVDALIEGKQVIYAGAPRSAARLSILPHMSPRSRGLMLSLRFERSVQARELAP